ncbi:MULTISPECIES: O-antigen ligase family protein [Eubacterium]|nr:O-antigen ligase family protein [Eubacterium barkeri]
MLACGMMALAMDQDDCFFSRLFKVWRNIAVVFGILTIINVFIPNLVYGYFSFLLTQAQIDTIQNNILLGGYPGIAGEVSFNCFCIAIGIAVQVIFLYFEKQKVRNFFILFLLFIALLLTGKRSMILILPIVSIIIFMLLAIEKRNKYVREILTLLIIAAPLVYLGLRDEITLILTKGGTSLALSNRDWFWNIAEEMFRKHPFWGNGINTYDFMYNEYKVRNGYVYFAGAHNSYLQYAAELGAIGLGVFIICILSEIIRTIKKINLDFKKHSSLISIENLFISLYAQLFCILYALSENPFYQPQQIMTYFIVISCLRCCRRKEKDEYFIS